MKIKNYLLGLILLTIPNLMFAQNRVDSELPIKCAEHLLYERMLNESPSFRIQDSIDRSNFELEYQNYLLTYDPNERSLYTVPVVVHVVHLDGPENISDAQIFDAIDRLNQDFNMLNSDLGNTVSSFSGIIGNPNIEFKLATKDPNGNCHSGITRTKSATANDEGFSNGTHPIVDAVANQHGVWPQNKYMSIFVCIDPSGAAGYTFRPSNAFSGNQMYGAIFMRHDYMGVIGTSSNTAKHTLSHEAGHWFNLAHLWGNSNSPGVASNCNGDDGVADTPNSIGWQSCNLNGTSCGSLDNVQNIMEYSYCSTMFSQGQAARVQAAVNSSTAGRNNLITNTNLAATGVLMPSSEICAAEFSTDRQIICQGGSIDFSDVSVHSITSRNWVFSGGSPNVSSDSIVSVTYNTPGTYTVTLEVSNATNTETTTITNYIKVLGVPGNGFPYSEGFDNQSSNFPDGQSFFTENPLNDQTWKLANVGSTGTKSAYIANHSANTTDTDELISGTIDLSDLGQTDDLVFSFDYAYKKKTASTNERLTVYVSKNCGETWALRKIIQGNSLSNSVSSSSFTPSQSDWQSISFNSISSSYYVSNFRYKFVFESENGNNIYIDNINMTADGYLSDIESVKTIKSAQIYPNPTENESILKLKGYSNNEISVSLFDITGKHITNVYQGTVNSNIVSIPLLLESLSKGVYFVKVNSDNKTSSTHRIIKE